MYIQNLFESGFQKHIITCSKYFGIMYNQIILYNTNIDTMKIMNVV